MTSAARLVQLSVLLRFHFLYVFHPPLIHGGHTSSSPLKLMSDHKRHRPDSFKLIEPTLNVDEVYGHMITKPCIGTVGSNDLVYLLMPAYF